MFDIIYFTLLSYIDTSPVSSLGTDPTSTTSGSMELSESVESKSPKVTVSFKLFHSSLF